MSSRGTSVEGRTPQPAATTCPGVATWSAQGLPHSTSHIFVTYIAPPPAWRAVFWHCKTDDLALWSSHGTTGRNGTTEPTNARTSCRVTRPKATSSRT
jgi:hypothetical protein